MDAQSTNALRGPSIAFPGETASLGLETRLVCGRANRRLRHPGNLSNTLLSAAAFATFLHSSGRAEVVFLSPDRSGTGRLFAHHAGCVGPEIQGGEPCRLAVGAS